MINLKSILFENSDNLDITIEDVQSLASSRHLSWDVKGALSVLEDFYFDEDPQKQQYAKDYLTLLNQVLEQGIKIAKGLNVPHVNLHMLKSYLLHQQEFKTNVEEFFPIPLYISAKPNADGDWAEIGIMIDQNGKVLEIHEGNDECAPETASLANRLINPSGKKERIWGLHGTDVVRKIEKTGYLPANLYVSPDRGHSSRHWDNTDRSMFTGIVDSNNLSKESDLDWKTIGPTKIERFQWV